MITFEVMLPLGAIAFYLFDSALLLFGNEFAFERRGRRWKSSPGSVFQFGGRRIFLPNPLTPGALLFRVDWQVPKRHGADAALDLVDLAQLLRPLRAIVLVQALLLIVLLAPVSILLGSGPMLLLLFTAYYGLSLVAIVALVQRRRGLGVSDRECLVHAFEMLACAPFALNIVRKLTLRRSRELPWLDIALQEFRTADRAKIQADIGEQVALLLLDQDPGSEKERRLAQLQAEIRERLLEPRRE